VRAPGDQGDVLTGLVQPAAEHAADGAGAEDDETRIAHEATLGIG
jgi:hypothetical protein